MRFDEKLTILRKQQGMSQEQLADRLGVTRQSVSKWESGLALQELMKIITLSEIFDVNDRNEHFIKSDLSMPA